MTDTTATTAATPGGTAAPGQAASAQQGAPQQGPTSTQSGQGQPGQGQQGDASGTAQQTGTTTTAATTTGDPAATTTATAPERYELSLPEASLLDQSDIEAVAALAKTRGWTNEQAQVALTEMHTSLSEQTTRFRTELDADPEVGGAQLEQAQLHARRALDRFLPEREVQGQRLRAAMNKSGYGNFLPLVTLLARIGKAMSEDQPVTGSPGRLPGGARRSDAEVLFGDAQGVTRPG